LINKKKILNQYWKKKGLIIKPKKFFSWNRTHCMIPTPIYLGGDNYRIFFGTRNYNNQSSITYAEISLGKKVAVLKYFKKQSLIKGKLGAFDDNGVLPSCIIREKGFYLMYYIGWKPQITTRYSLIAGLAISKNGKIFKRYSESPILNTNQNEPYSILTAPFVIKIRKNKWFMWYVSCKYWKNKWPIFIDEFKNDENGVNLYSFIEILNKNMTEKEVIVCDAGSAIYVPCQNLKLKLNQIFDDFYNSFTTSIFSFP
jgi:hypothetical protein